MARRMYRTIRSAFTLLATVVAAPTVLADFRCSLIASPAGTVTRAGSKLELPAQADACEGLRVASGAIIACVQDRRARLQCQTFSAGETLSAKKLRPAPGNKSWELALLDLLRGGESQRPAVTRGPDEAFRAYLPQGSVLLLAPDFVIDFSDPALRETAAIEFRSDAANGPVLTTVSGNGRMRVRTDLFQRGKTYWWSIQTRDAMLPQHGSFLVLGEPSLREARARKASLVAGAAAAARDPAASLPFAEWLAGRNLVFDSAQELLRAGFRLHDAGAE